MKRIEPTPATAHGIGGAAVLTESQVTQWRERGFTLVDGLFPDALVQRAVADAKAVFPAPGTTAVEAENDFGSRGRMTFPAASAAVNELTLHPRLLRAVAELLGVQTSGLRLTQSDLWPKYGRKTRSGAALDNADQRIHVDYPNHTLAHPPRWDEPEAVELILYLSDAEDAGGQTRLVPRNGPDDSAYPWPITRTPGVAGLEWVNDRTSAERYLGEVAPDVARWRGEHLYPREVAAHYRVGTVLFYRHDTWHRGTPLSPGALRLAHNMTFRKAESEWISTLHAGWAWAMYRPSRVTEKLVAAASVEQRCVLGFPAPGDGYWTRETIDAVAERYPGIDMAHYERGLTPAPIPDKVDLREKLGRFTEHWSPRIVGELNGHHVKLVKLQGEFVWHDHANEDELFLVLSGRLDIHLRDRVVELSEGQFFVVPRGIEHKPVARGEVEALLFEPASTRNTGNVSNDRTVESPEKI